ncbi:hypothetical protein K1720_04405 [Thermococcus argininiproducens]|uniref:Uncharacterized protein n=1 Tax=Thermococcus argininiproducens TaxID=2866384 RepID=A0A9E7SD17_9EURY|nr:hypothetical protein [Thermococcus argininiproducens]USH00684.1 hypothetical protein K1720_04405 [Thermococcus argininiproducens]
METSAKRPLIMGLRAMFLSIKQRALEVEKEYAELLDKLTADNLRRADFKIFFEFVNATNSLPKDIDFPEIINKIQKIKGILDSYNRAVSFFQSSIQDGPPLRYISYTVPHLVIAPSNYLQEVVTYCELALGILEGYLLSEQITPQERDRLERTREKIETLYECNPALVEHLKEAIKEFEMGHDLASALIAGKCFIYIEEQLCSSFGLNKNKHEERAKLPKMLGERLGLPRNMVEKIVKASVLARNTFTHNINSRPSHENALSLLADTVTFAEYLCKIMGNSEG